MAVSNKPWSDVDKSKLPRSCYLWIEGDGSTKDQWRLPVYEGAGTIDKKTGMYTERGALNLEAVRAAAAAVAGARTGTSMNVPQSVKDEMDRMMRREKMGQFAEARGDAATGEITFTTDLSEAKIDREARIIRGVAILTKYSKGTDDKVRREYSDAALRSAVEVFEGAPAYIDHGDPKKERSFHDAYGFYRDCRAVDLGTEKARTVGDIHCLDCEEGRKVMSLAEINPAGAGNSIHAAGKHKMKGSIQCVEQVLPRTMWGHKSSVDLVIDPATTSNLFEQKTGKKEKSMELKDVNLEEMRAGRPDLVAGLLKEGAVSRDAEVAALIESKAKLETERAALAAKVDAFEVQAAMAKKSELVEQLLAEAKLPAEAVTETFRGQLLNLAERKEGGKTITVAEQAKELIEDRRALLGGVRGNTGKGGPGNGAAIDNRKAAAALRASRRG